MPVHFNSIHKGGRPLVVPTFFICHAERSEASKCNSISAAVVVRQAPFESLRTGSTNGFSNTYPALYRDKTTNDFINDFLHI
jgi:hypothetical protein